MNSKKVWKYFQMCAQYANMPELRDGPKEYFLASVGIRGKDGVVVMSRNGSAKISPVTYNLGRIYSGHSEIRVLSKMSNNSVLFVARIGRSGLYRMAMPCAKCTAAIKTSGKINRVYYTISPDSFGILNF